MLGASFTCAVVGVRTAAERVIPLKLNVAVNNCAVRQLPPLRIMQRARLVVAVPVIRTAQQRAGGGARLRLEQAQSVHTECIKRVPC